MRTLTPSQNRHFKTIPVPAGRGGPAFVRFGAANEVGAFVTDVVHFAAGGTSAFADGLGRFEARTGSAPERGARRGGGLSRQGIERGRLAGRLESPAQTRKDAEQNRSHRTPHRPEIRKVHRAPARASQSENRPQRRQDCRGNSRLHFTNDFGTSGIASRFVESEN